MATANCTLTFVRTMDDCYPDSAAAYHFGYGNAGQHWCTCYKCVVPSYTGTPSQITFTLSVNRGTAYPTNKNSTWKLGLDETEPIWSAADGEYSAGSVYADGLYSRTGSWIGTFTGSITSTTVSKTVTITTSSAILDGGNTFYVYLFSGANASNSIKVTSISATITYSTESITGTNLVIGTSSSPSSTYAYPTPKKRTVYWKVTGLQNALNTYSGFYLYLSSGFSFTQGSTTAPTGTLVASYTSLSSAGTGKEFTRSFNVPSSNIKITNGNIGVVCVALSGGSYWRIGGSSNTPKTCYIKLAALDWYKNAISVAIKSLGQTSVTYNITHNGYNDPRYLEYVDYCTGQTSTTGSSSETGYKSTVSFPSSTSSSVTKTLTVSSLSAGTSYTHYFTADTTTSYASYGFYGLDSITFTTDANYSATVKALDISSTGATISFSGLTSEINLTENYYYTKTDKGSSCAASSFSYDGSGERSGAAGGFGVSCSAATSYTYYIYVYSGKSNTYYKIGSVTFTTDASSYSATISGSATGSTTATANISGLSSTTNLNSNWYLSTTSSATATSLANVVSAARTSSISLTGLTSGASNTRYAYVYSSASGIYYKVGSISITTDAPSYSGTPTSTVTGSTTGTTSLASVTPTTNLDGNFYVSTTNNTTASSLTSPTSATRGNAASLTGLTAGTTNTRYVYVKSSASGVYYKVGSVSIVTDANSYSATIGTSSVTPVGGNITISSLSSTTNLDANWYISTTNNTSLPTSLTTAGSAVRNNAISLSCTPGASATYYAYVKSAASGKYYQIGNTSMTNPTYSGTINVKKISDTKIVCTFSELNYTTGLNSNWYLVSPAGARFGEFRNKEIIVTGLTPATANTLTAQVYNLDKNTYYNASTKSVTTRASGFKACNTDIVINGTRNKYEPRAIISSASKDYYPVAYLPNYLPKLGKTVTITNLIPNMAHEESSPNINTNSIVTANTTYVHNGSASLCIKPTASSAESTWPISYTTASGYNNNVSLNASHKYYLSVWLYQPVKVGSFDFYWPIAEPNFISGQSVSAANTWTHISYVNTRGSFTTGNYQPRIDFNNPDGTNAMYYADLMLIDLTTSFGSGNEPTKQWCDEHIPYIKTSMSLSV